MTLNTHDANSSLAGSQATSGDVASALHVCQRVCAPAE